MSFTPVDPRVQLLNDTLHPHGNVPWQSKWGQVPRDMQAKVHAFALYITKKNFDKYQQRDSDLNFRHCLQQATRGFMGEMFFYVTYGVRNNMMIPDWYAAPEDQWPTMSVSWAPDHGAPPPFGFTDSTVGFEDKTGRFNDPGWALQWNSDDRRSRQAANRMPLAIGAVGPHYYLTLIECKHQKNTRGIPHYMYRVAAIVRGIDIYNNRNMTYNGVPLLGPMANGNRNKLQLTKEVLYNNRLSLTNPIVFYRPAYVTEPPQWLHTFTTEDFPTLKPITKRKSCLKKSTGNKKARVTFDQRPDKIRIIENCLCPDDLEDGEIQEPKSFRTLFSSKKYGAFANKLSEHLKTCIEAAYELYCMDLDEADFEHTCAKVIHAAKDEEWPALC